MTFLEHEEESQNLECYVWRCNVNQPPPCRAEFNTEWKILSASSVWVHGVHDNIAFTFLWKHFLLFTKAHPSECRYNFVVDKNREMVNRAVLHGVASPPFPLIIFFKQGKTCAVWNTAIYSISKLSWQAWLESVWFYCANCWKCRSCKITIQ